jgi:hypothetical protein
LKELFPAKRKGTNVLDLLRLLAESGVFEGGKGSFKVLEGFKTKRND